MKMNDRCSYCGSYEDLVKNRNCITICSICSKFEDGHFDTYRIREDKEVLMQLIKAHRISQKEFIELRDGMSAKYRLIHDNQEEEEMKKARKRTEKEIKKLKWEYSKRGWLGAAKWKLLR